MNKKIYKLLFVFIIFILFVGSVNAEEIDENVALENDLENKEEIKEDIQSGKIDYSGEKYRLIIDDQAGLLTYDEIKKLEDKMIPLLEYGNIAFISVSENSYSSTDKLAEKQYKSYFSNESGSLFLIDMDMRNIYIFSDGYNYNVITKNKSYIITDNIYKLASREKYYDCAYSAFDQMETLLNGGKILEPMRYISNALISLTIGSFIAFFIAIKMTSIKKATDKELLKCVNSQIIINSITGKKTGTHRVYSPQSDSSSSGGSSSGGGGGHSF